MGALWLRSHSFFRSEIGEPAATMYGPASRGGLSEKNTNDDHHQADNRKKQRTQIDRHHFLQFCAHVFIAQPCTFGAADADDAIDQT